MICSHAVQPTSYLCLQRSTSHPVILCRSVEAGLSEIKYTFLKRLCQVLCALGGQLCALVVSVSPVWLMNDLFLSCRSVGTEGHVLAQGSYADVAVPANLSQYMEAFLAFTTHPSQVKCQDSHASVFYTFDPWNEPN